jgi:hypothetical protein
MSLSGEAIICLRAPTGTKLPAPPEYRDPSVRFPARLLLPIFTILPLAQRKLEPSRAVKFYKEPPLYQAIIGFKEDTDRTWEVICWRKQGQLEVCIIDGDSELISYNGSSTRAEWRNFHSVNYYEMFDGEAGIEIWDSKGISERLTDSTLQKIQDAIQAIEIPNLAKLADNLQEV